MLKNLPIKLFDILSLIIFILDLKPQPFSHCSCRFYEISNSILVESTYLPNMPYHLKHTHIPCWDKHISYIVSSLHSKYLKIGKSSERNWTHNLFIEKWIYFNCKIFSTCMNLQTEFTRVTRAAGVGCARYIWTHGWLAGNIWMSKQLKISTYRLWGLMNKFTKVFLYSTKLPLT